MLLKIYKLVPGRMDMHIDMPYNTFSTFKRLAARYLDICHSQLFKVIPQKVEANPANGIKFNCPKTLLQQIKKKTKNTSIKSKNLFNSLGDNT
jgi:chaperone BCS1